ncbi:MAG: hypothetical protein ACR2IS_08485 [Nitrososphaeraceae archaeon]
MNRHTKNAAYQVGMCTSIIIISIPIPYMNIIYSSLNESITLRNTGSELSNSSGIPPNVITFAIPSFKASCFDEEK